MTHDIDQIKALLDSGDLGKAWHDLGELLHHQQAGTGSTHTLDSPAPVLGGGGGTTNPPPPGGPR